MFRYIESRPNGLPPVERTWTGVGMYNPRKRYGPLAHVVAVSWEDSDSLWVIDSLDLLPDLMRMLADIEHGVDAYSVLQPLPAFREEA